jgi:broad specificity phosphatase PhoE
MTEDQQFILIRHGESETNATTTFPAGNQYDTDPLTRSGHRTPAASANASPSCPSTSS